MPRHNDPFADLDNMSWDDDFASRDSRGRKALLALVGLIIIGAVALGAFYLLRGTLLDSPARAAEGWLKAVAKGDTDRALDLTCSEQLQIAPVLSLTDMIGGDAAKDLGLSEWLKNIKVDLKSLKYAATDGSTGESQVTVKGVVRVKAFGDFWLPVPVNQRWRMVEEDNTWKWCGLAP